MPWFENWFDTSYYHTLYQHRDEVEAERLVNQIANHFPPDKFPNLCDAACGKGRHAKSFADKGFNVNGFDLSENSIRQAKTLENEKLNFFVHDITQDFADQKYNIITNLFTSFGYFDAHLFDLQALGAINRALKPQGIFVQDYLNAELVSADESEQEKELDGITFNTHKRIEEDKVIKDITVIDGAETHTYQEKVSLFKLSDFERMYKSTQFELLNVYGDYNFNSFVPQSSPRLIMVSKKRD